MKQSLRALFAAFALILLSSTPAFAQFDLGLRAGFDLEAEEPFVGAEARFALPIGTTPLQLAPAVDYFVTGGDEIGGVDIDETLIQIDVNVLYPFGVDNQAFTPYAGVGLGITYASVDAAGVDASETDFGANLIGGAYFGSGNLRPFVQARIQAGGAGLFSVMGGVLLRLGGQ